MDPNVIELEKHKHVIFGAAGAGAPIAALLMVLVAICLCFIFCLRYKRKLKQMIINDPNATVRIYADLIKDKSLGQDSRKELIKKLGELIDNVEQYQKDTADARTSNGQATNTMELSEVAPHSPNNNIRTQSDYETEDNKESLVDQALSEFVAKYCPRNNN